jgi:hypothetical protein
MDKFIHITLTIIKEQELIIGPLAWIEAGKVQGLKIVNSQNGEVTFNNGDQKEVINRLVAQYERLFGRASHEVCRDAVSNIIAGLSPSEIPSSLAV